MDDSKVNNFVRVVGLEFWEGMIGYFGLFVVRMCVLFIRFENLIYIKLGLIGGL